MPVVLRQGLNRREIEADDVYTLLCVRHDGSPLCLDFASASNLFQAKTRARRLLRETATGSRVEIWLGALVATVAAPGVVEDDPRGPDTPMAW